MFWEVVVVMLAEGLFPIPEVCGSNPVIGENLHHRTVLKRRTEKEVANGQILKEDFVNFVRF